MIPTIACRPGHREPRTRCERDRVDVRGHALVPMEEDGVHVDVRAMVRQDARRALRMKADDAYPDGYVDGEAERVGIGVRMGARSGDDMRAQHGRRRVDHEHERTPRQTGQGACTSDGVLQGLVRHRTIDRGRHWILDRTDGQQGGAVAPDAARPRGHRLAGIDPGDPDLAGIDGHLAGEALQRPDSEASSAGGNVADCDASLGLAVAHHRPHGTVLLG